MANATGWNELIDGNLTSAAFKAYNIPMQGWPIAILFFLFQFMLYMKTKNATLCWIAGLLFTGAYISGNLMLDSGYIIPTSMKFIFVVLSIELGIIMYVYFFK